MEKNKGGGLIFQYFFLYTKGEISDFSGTAQLFSRIISLLLSAYFLFLNDTVMYSQGYESDELI